MRRGTIVTHQLASLSFEVGHRIPDLWPLLAVWRDCAVITFALLQNTAHISHHSLLRPAGLKMFSFKRSYLASSLVTNGLESSLSFSCDVNIIIPLLSELEQRYLAKPSAFSASSFACWAGLSLLCVWMKCVQGELIWCKKHFKWRNLLLSTPCWTCALMYHWLYVTSNDCLVLFGVLGKASLPNPDKSFCISEIPLHTMMGALFTPCPIALFHAAQYLHPSASKVSVVKVLYMYTQTPVLLSTAPV